MELKDYFIGVHDSLKIELNTRKQRFYLSRDRVVSLLDEYEHLRDEHNLLKNELIRLRDRLNALEI